MDGITYPCPNPNQAILANGALISTIVTKTIHMVMLFLEFRLVNGPSSASGRIEVYYRGVWGTVCDDGFQQYAGDMICKELGYQWVQSQWLRI